METFADVLSKAKNDFLELLSSRSEIDQIFGSNAAESELFIVRLVAIIIFSVHNASREPDDQTHAENLQRAVLLQNARVASYEFMGLILERCLELQDPLSSFLLPGVLVFVEWLACCPESVHVGEDEKLAKVRASFWKNCVSIFNKLVSSGLLDEAEFSFINMSRDVDGELQINSLFGRIMAFWKNSLGFEGGNKAKKTRLQRIIAAGKTLSSVVRVGKQVMYLDLKLKKFVFGAELEMSCELAPKIPEAPQFNKEDVATEKRMDFVLLKPPPQLFVDGEDEIVFKPSAADKIVDAIVPALTPDDVLLTVADAPPCNLSSYVASVAPDVGTLGQTSFDTNATIFVPLYNGVAQHALPIQPKPSNWQLKQEASIINGIGNSSFMEDGYSMKMKMQEQYGSSQPPSLPLPSMQPAPDTVMSSKISVQPILCIYTEWGFDCAGITSARWFQKSPSG